MTATIVQQEQSSVVTEIGTMQIQDFQPGVQITTSVQATTRTLTITTIWERRDPAVIFFAKGDDGELYRCYYNTGNGAWTTTRLP